MYLRIPYETALACHPKLVQVVMDKLARGKSKERGSAPETLEWGYSWSLSVKCITLSEMLKGVKPVETRTLDERIHCGLTGSKGRWKETAFYMGTGMHPVPPEVMATMEASLNPPTTPSPSELESALRELNPTVVVLSGMSDTLTRSDITGFHTKD